jgi:ribosome recycling factor
MRPLAFVSLFLTTLTASVNGFLPFPATARGSHVRVPPSSLFMSTSEVSVDEITLDAEERMGKSVNSVKANLNTIRTGRASANMLDRVTVDYYGVETPLNQMATISVPSAQQLTVDPYDKSQCNDIEKSIMESGLGLTPNNDGSIIRINIPDLTEDRRKDMLKQCKAIGEEGKVAVRNIRRDGVDAIKKMEKSGDISEDQSKDGQDSMQKLTDKKVKEIDELVSKKEKEVMKV